MSFGKGKLDGLVDADEVLVVVPTAGGVLRLAHALRALWQELGRDVAPARPRQQTTEAWIDATASELA